MKIRPVVAEFPHAEGQTDVIKQISAFHNFTNVPKIHFTVRISFSFLTLCCPL